MNKTKLARRGALVMMAGIALTLSIPASAGAAGWSQARAARAFIAAVTPEFSTRTPSLAAVQRAATGLRSLETHTAGQLHTLIVRAANASAAMARAYAANASSKTLTSDALKQGKAVALAAIRLGVFSKVEALQKAAGAF